MNDAIYPEPPWLRKISALFKTGPTPVLSDEFLDTSYDFPRFTKTPSLYLIAATPRSGSHYLGHLIFATKQLGAPHEYLSVPQYRRWSQIVGSEDPKVVLQEIIARRTSPNGWFGVQAHWFQMRNIARFKIPRDILNFRRIIWIRRRDIIEQAVSFAIGLQTGAWSSFHKPMREPTYDYRAIADCADAIEQMESEWKRFLTQATIPYLSLFYEDIRADETKVIAHILEWFGLPPCGRFIIPTAAKAGNRDQYCLEGSFPARQAAGFPV